MTLTDNDKLNLALEIMEDRDVDKFESVCNLAERKGIDIYEALTIFENQETFTTKQDYQNEQNNKI